MQKEYLAETHRHKLILLVSVVIPSKTKPDFMYFVFGSPCVFIMSGFSFSPVSAQVKKKGLYLISQNT